MADILNPLYTDTDNYEYNSSLKEQLLFLSPHKLQDFVEDNIFNKDNLYHVLTFSPTIPESLYIFIYQAGDYDIKNLILTNSKCPIALLHEAITSYDPYLYPGLFSNTTIEMSFLMSKFQEIVSNYTGARAKDLNLLLQLIFSRELSAVDSSVIISITDSTICTKEDWLIILTGCVTWLEDSSCIIPDTLSTKLYNFLITYCPYIDTEERATNELYYRFCSYVHLPESVIESLYWYWFRFDSKYTDPWLHLMLLNIVSLSNTPKWILDKEYSTEILLLCRYAANPNLSLARIHQIMEDLKTFRGLLNKPYVYARTLICSLYLHPNSPSYVRSILYSVYFEKIELTLNSVKSYVPFT